MSQASMPPPQSSDAPAASGTSSRSPVASSPPPADAVAAVEGTVKRLRAELSGTPEKPRQARLLAEIADIEERAGDEPAAARDYLAAFNADPAFREPLEGLVRLLERRRSLKNLGRLVDALARAAATPEEKGRALLMKAAYLEDVAQDLDGAVQTLREALDLDLPPTVASSAWLALELIAAKRNDDPARTEALAQRARCAADSTWKALLLVDLASLTARAGDVERALAILDEVCGLETSATWSATCAIEQLARRLPASAEHAATLAAALEAQASLVERAIADGADGDRLGVPRWTRTPIALADLRLRAAEGRRAAGDLPSAAALLDRALEAAAGADHGAFVTAVLQTARMRVADMAGDPRLAATLAERRLAVEKDGGLAAALAMRVAEQAAREGDASRALDALSRALDRDPTSIPARTLQLDLLADGGDVAAFAAQLESFADRLENDDARGRAFLLAAWIWGARAGDVPGAKAALTQAAMYGVSPATVARLARAMASARGDALWYEEATKRLLASGADEHEITHLWFELARARFARDDVEGGRKALRELGNTPGGTWLGHALEAFVPAPPTGLDAAPNGREASRRGALEKLAALEPDPERARALVVLAAIRAQAEGDLETARTELRTLAEHAPEDLFVATLLTDLDRLAGDRHAAAERAFAAAVITDDAEAAAARFLEAGFERWIAGDKDGALDAFKNAAERAPDTGKLVCAWALRAVSADSIQGRRQALAYALEAGDDPQAIALERFAAELGGGNADEAKHALDAAAHGTNGDLATAAALARLLWSAAGDSGLAAGVLARFEDLGTDAKAFAAVERLDRARGEGAEALVDAARTWSEAGGGLLAALEWLAAAIAAGRAEDERAAEAALARALTGEAREAVEASSALSRAYGPDGEQVPLVEGASGAVRLANLELAPPGSDPRRRATALVGVDGVLGNEAQIDALGLAGWSAVAMGDTMSALTAFRKVVEVRPEDLAAWEGVRLCAEARGDHPLRATAASELGARCADPERAGAFWEEAGLVWLDAGDEARAEAAFEAGFERDPARNIAFDKIFRLTRDRKDGDKLLTLIGRRLQVARDPKEVIKLHWETARVLREKGDPEGALSALENVTLLEPDHVGALALTGEIAIRQGRFEEAAAALARLSRLDAAPGKNRLTAAVAAVDLYENKLGAFDKALDVMLGVHRAKLAPLPVRERLARTAARVGAWREAATALEELMYERPEAEGRREAARIAMAVYRDRLNDPKGAGGAVVKLLEESPMDGEALDMLLATEQPPQVRDRLLVGARHALVAHLRIRPTDAVAVRRLVKVARALGDAAFEQAALGVSIALGPDGAPPGWITDADQRLSELAAAKPRTPQGSAIVLRALLAPGDEGPIADLFALLAPTLVEAFGPSVSGCGVGRRDRVDARSGLAIRQEVLAWANVFGIADLELYVGGREPRTVQGIPTEDPAFVLGHGITAPFSLTSRAQVARELAAMAHGTTLLRRCDDATVAGIVVAACRLADVPIDYARSPALAEVEKAVSKAIPRRTKKQLPDLCRAVAASSVDARTWALRAVASHDRVATVASGDVSAVLADVLRVPRADLGPAVRGNDRAEELLRFVFAPAYLEMRRTLGLEGAP